ncbi:hypothetical protein CHH78_00690 [Shouchella clausii]|uniref:DUF624 domain-containing protein n=2 Tax=Shouchella clausii TaxID=79880 RepID=A0A268S5A4_SHOCL|nr:hypothetical protein BC8716_04395 [Shouchella clausii]PAD43557.1 hypothetical protein CHH54_06460 [Bacillus sp. 7520-S]PAD10491.1 hypothetical protein CHH76_03780 [Shouchella clausii]PAD16308.1 hypothetical protein CHH74_04280 [Shouchella clausii]PAE86551.1 hypothetical protein CHH78_00690 [Shouchella clausii]
MDRSQKEDGLMDEKGLRGYALRLCDWLVRLAALNCLWLVFSLLGGVIVGFFPAMYAMFAVMKRWCLKEGNVPLVRTFFQEWKSAFWRANIVGFTVALVGAILVVDYLIVFSLDFPGATAAAALLMLCLLVYGLGVLFVGPALVVFDGALIPFLKNVALLAIASVRYAAFMAVFLCLAALLFVLVPPAGFCFAGSLFAWVTTHFSLKAFQRAKLLSHPAR